MKINHEIFLALSTLLLLLSACASVPNGPSAMAMPGTGMNFDRFQSDDASCRQFAQGHIGGKTAQQAANESFAGSALVGTVLGAAMGTAADGGSGAGEGAAIGLFMGSLIGIEQANGSSHETQRRYDNAYIQCMYGKGHRVPVHGRIEQQPAYRVPPSRPAGYPIPPPPPRYVPLKPPDAP